MRVKNNKRQLDLVDAMKIKWNGAKWVDECLQCYCYRVKTADRWNLHAGITRKRIGEELVASGNHLPVRVETRSVRIDLLHQCGGCAGLRNARRHRRRAGKIIRRCWIHVTSPMV